MKKLFYGIFITVFFAVCIIPSAGMLIFGESQAAANEILASKPELILEDGTFNMSFNDDATSYIADRMAFRQEIITAYAALKAAVTGESAAEDVIVGKDGWLFYSETLDDYLHRNTLSQRSINGIARTMKLVQDYVESQGADFVFTVAPDKNSLYGRYMPDSGRPLNTEKNAVMLEKTLEAEDVEYADLFTAFGDHKEILYHKRDSHWTNKGAALAWYTLTNLLGKLEESGNDNLSFCDGFFFTSSETVKNHKGDLYEMLYPAGKDLDEDVEFDQKFTFGYAGGPDSYYDDSKPPHDSMRIETVCDGAQGNLLMFRDSFGNSLYPFMAESYNHAVFLRQFPYNLTVLEEESEYGPVTSAVIEIVERNIPNLAENPPVIPAPRVNLEGEASIETLAEDGSALSEADKIRFISSDSDVLYEAEPAGNMEGYTFVKGVYGNGQAIDAAHMYDENTRIYIEINGIFYEACPVGSTDWLGEEAEKWQEDCCFSAYIPGEFSAAEISSVVLQLNGKYFKTKPILEQ